MKAALAGKAYPGQVLGLGRFFKSGPGQYGEGDEFASANASSTVDSWPSTTHRDSGHTERYGMDKPTQLHPTIADLLDEFFSEYKSTAPGPLRQRIDLVRAHLARHLEEKGERQLTTPQLEILATERTLDPVAAFARTMHAPELYYVIGEYLGGENAMHPDALRSTQVDVVAALASFLWSRRLISQNTISECALIEFDIAVDRARKPGRTEPGGTRP